MRDKRNSVPGDRFLGAGFVKLEFPKKLIIKILTLRRTAESMTPDDNVAKNSESVNTCQIEEITGSKLNYLPGDRFTVELNHQIDLLTKAYKHDSRLYQRMLGELIAGSLTPLLEEERERHRTDFSQELEETIQKVNQLVTRKVKEKGFHATINIINSLLDLHAVEDRKLRDLQQQYDGEIETQQSIGQQTLITVNEIIQLYHWLPSYLHSSSLPVRLSVLLGLIILSFVLGSFWNIYILVTAVVISAIPAIWFLFMRRMPSPQSVEPVLHAYYLVFGQRIFLEERRRFWNAVFDAFDAHRKSLSEIYDKLKQQKNLLEEKWQSLKKGIFSSPSHVQFLLLENELEGWYQGFLEDDDQLVLQEFREICLKSDYKEAIDFLEKRYMENLSSKLQYTAEQRLNDMSNGRSIDMLFGPNSGIMNRLFTLAVRPGRLRHQSRYHRFFLIGMNNPQQSELAERLREQLKKHDLGVKFIENGNPHKICIIGIEGGFELGALREAPEMADHYRLHRNDPLIYPDLRRKSK